MRWLLVVLVSTLLGCATPGRPPIFGTADAALAAAQQDVDAGRWQMALAKLQAAEQQFADEPAIAARRAELNARWSALRAQWEDRLALVRAQARWDELVLLQRLELAETDDFLNKLQLEHKKALLLASRSKLIGCAQRQLDQDLELAKRCVDLAHSVQADNDSRELRAQVAAKQASAAIALQAEQAAKQAEVAAEHAEKRQIAVARRARLLKLAQVLADQERYVRALTLVHQVLEDEPDNQRAKTLQAQLQEHLARQSRLLSELADRLYGESNVAAAIQIWEASLRLVPDQPDVVERYERAKRVQGNLEQLRDAPEQSPDAVNQGKP